MILAVSQLSGYHLRRPWLAGRVLGASVRVIVGGAGYGKSAEAAEFLDHAAHQAAFLVTGSAVRPPDAARLIATRGTCREDIPTWTAVVPDADFRGADVRHPTKRRATT
jgi:adenosyl cobinamide kinase/adenosyl cobinamide phosphate guanylyltransferase